MSTDNEWQRPKKPYVVKNDKPATGYQGGYDNQPYEKKPFDKKPYEKKSFAPKAKPVIIPAKNNANNKVLHDCMKQGGLIKISINNLLCSDEELNATYEGKIVSFDDFTILIETFNGSFLINKSSIAVLEFHKNAHQV